MRLRIAPQFSKANFVCINLNDVTKELNDKEHFGSTPLDQTCIIHRSMSLLDDSMVYGGWLEDQQYFMRIYANNDSDTMVHIGLDVMLPIGTEIVAHDTGHVVQVYVDSSTTNGWGGRVIVKYDNPTNSGFPFMIYGHLHPNRIAHTNQKLNVGDTIGFITNEAQNGGWFPHVHVQIVDQIFLDMFDEESIDGFVTKKEQLDNVLLHICDPTTTVFEMDS